MSEPNKTTRMHNASGAVLVHSPMAALDPPGSDPRRWKCEGCGAVAKSIKVLNMQPCITPKIGNDILVDGSIDPETGVTPETRAIIAGAYARIRMAHLEGRGVHLSAEECWAIWEKDSAVPQMLMMYEDSQAEKNDR